MLQKSTLLFTAVMAGNVFGYLFQLSMGRMLTIKEYGELNALMSMMVIFGIPFQTMVNFFSKNSAVYAVNNEFGKIRTFWRKGLNKLLIFLMLLLILLFFFSNQLADFLHASVIHILFIGGCVFFSAIVSLNAGVIQGLQYFNSLAVINSGTHVIRFIFGFLFVWIGFGLNGALIAILAASLFLFIFSQYRIYKILPAVGTDLDFSFLNVYKYAFGLFLANLLFGVMTQIDVMLVKHFFSPVDAGFYTSAAVIGKAVLYLPGAIVLAMFPMVASNHAVGNSSFGMVCKALVFSGILTGTGALLLYFFPDTIVSVLYGERYLPASRTISVFGVAMLPVSLSFLLMHYLLAQGQTRFIVFMGAAAILEITLIYCFHSTLSSILFAIMMAGLLMFTALFSKVLLDHYHFLPVTDQKNQEK